MNNPRMLDKLRELSDKPTTYTSDEFPLVLAAGERRSFTANTIFRDPDWRKRDRNGALRISPADAERLGLDENSRASVTTPSETLTTTVEISTTMQPGHVSLPNGLGLDYPGDDGGAVVTGTPPNELTWSEHRDEFAGTPWHKHVPARIEAAD